MSKDIAAKSSSPQTETKSGETTAKVVRLDSNPDSSRPSVVSVQKKVVRGVVQADGKAATQAQPTPGKTPVKPLARTASLAMGRDADPGTGIGDRDGMAPVVGDGVELSYGKQLVHATNAKTLACPLVPYRTQQVSAQLTGTFYVYHECGHGQDSFLVVYKEDGILSTANSDHPLIVTMGEKWDDTHAGTGFALYRMDTSVVPVTINGQPLDNQSVSWVCSSPSTVNKEESKTDQTVESFNQSVTLNAKDGASATYSHDYQIWHSTTIDVTDWGIEEQSDAAANKGAWMFFQNTPWAGTLGMPLPFIGWTWWEAAYNVGGGWDDVKPFNALSTGVMQYHTCAAWRFANPGDGQPLRVKFSGQMTGKYCLVAMPQLGNGGHHTLFTDSLPNAWEVELDLIELSQLE